jgi:MATE family multidrug resistance protein
MLNRAGLVVMLFVDTTIVGHISTLEQARFGAALIPVVVLQVIAVGMLIGVIVLTAAADGAGRSKDCGQIWRLGMLIAVVVGVAFGCLLSIGSPILAHLLQQPMALAQAAGPVLSILGWGLPGLLLFAACAHSLEGLSKPIAPLAVMVLGNVLNLGLAYLLGFGAFGWPSLGALGVALATTLSRTAMGAAGVAIVLYSPRAAHYGMQLDFSGGLKGIGRLLRLGLPLALAIGLETMCFSTVINMGSWIDEQAIAVMSAAINYTSLVYMLTTGLATAASVRVANALSTHDWASASRAGWIAVALIALVMSILAIFTAAFSTELAGVYTADPKVLGALAPLLATGISVMLIMDGLQGVLMGALRGCADTFWPTLTYGVCFWILGVPIAYYWGYLRGGGPPMLVIALTIALSAAMLALGLRFRHLTHKAKVY